MVLEEKEKYILSLISFHRIDLADIVDVRKGFSTDIFNEVIQHEDGKFFQLFQFNFRVLTEFVFNFHAETELFRFLL